MCLSVFKCGQNVFKARSSGFRLCLRCWFPYYEKKVSSYLPFLLRRRITTFLFNKMVRRRKYHLLVREREVPFFRRRGANSTCKFISFPFPNRSKGQNNTAFRPHAFQKKTGFFSEPSRMAGFPPIGPGSRRKQKRNESNPEKLNSSCCKLELST